MEPSTRHKAPFFVPLQVLFGGLAGWLNLTKHIARPAHVVWKRSEKGGKDKGRELPELFEFILQESFLCS